MASVETMAWTSRPTRAAARSSWATRTLRSPSEPRHCRQRVPGMVLECLAGLDRCIEMNRPKAWRRRQDHQVGTAIKRFLVGVEPAELAIGRNIYGRILEQRIFITFAARELFVDVIQTGLHVVGKGIGGRPQRDLAFRCQSLNSGSGATATGVTDTVAVVTELGAPPSSTAWKLMVLTCAEGLSLELK